MTDGINFPFLDFCHALSPNYPFIWIARLVTVVRERDFSRKCCLSVLTFSREEIFHFARARNQTGSLRTRPALEITHAHFVAFREKMRVLLTYAYMFKIAFKG